MYIGLGYIDKLGLIRGRLGLLSVLKLLNGKFLDKLEFQVV